LDAHIKRFTEGKYSEYKGKCVVVSFQQHPTLSVRSAPDKVDVCIVCPHPVLGWNVFRVKVLRAGEEDRDVFVERNRVPADICGRPVRKYVPEKPDSVWVRLLPPGTDPKTPLPQGAATVGDVFEVIPTGNTIDAMLDAVATKKSFSRNGVIRAASTFTTTGEAISTTEALRNNTRDFPYLVTPPVVNVWVRVLPPGTEPNDPIAVTLPACLVTPLSDKIDSLKDAVKVKLGTDYTGNPAKLTVYCHDVTTGKWTKAVRASTPLDVNTEETVYHVVLPS
jgi:hypothetical protein